MVVVGEQKSFKNVDSCSSWILFFDRGEFSLLLLSFLRTSLVEKLFFTRSVELPLHEKDGIDREMREARKKPIFQIIEWFHGTHWHASRYYYGTALKIYLSIRENNMGETTTSI